MSLNEAVAKKFCVKSMLLIFFFLFLAHYKVRYLDICLITFSRFYKLFCHNNKALFYHDNQCFSNNAGQLVLKKYVYILPLLLLTSTGYIDTY